MARAETFSYTGDEQIYTVPPGVSNVQITAVGAAGGSPPQGTGVPGGRGAIVTGVVPVAAGQVLYVYVGGAGELPAGGFNGGADGGVREGWMAWGGGGASDVSTIPDSAGVASFKSRVIVAAGGGGSAGIAAGGGDAGNPGGCCGAVGIGPNAAQPGTQTAGGAGGGTGCDSGAEGCGYDGGLGWGGDGGASGTIMNASAVAGGGGGGGLYGGGGGAGQASDIGGGAGGSSLVPPGGSLAIAQRTTPARIEIHPYSPPPPPPRCADGIDNDGDALTDFPADPGCASTTDDDEANVTAVQPTDTTAPAARLTGLKKQKLGRTIATTLNCGIAEDCIVSAKGTLSIRHAARRYALNSAKRRTVKRGTARVLKLRVPAKTRAAVARALQRRKKVRATLTVTVADAAGNATTLTRHIRIVR